MQFTNVLALLALALTLALATPISSPNNNEMKSSLARRDGHQDFCGKNLPRAGDACSFGSSETEPHACSVNDETVVMQCDGFVWTVDHSCPTAQSCQCDKGVPERGNLVCR